MNYLIIDKNDIYGDIYDLIEDKELNMNKPDDRELIEFHIEKYILSAPYIKYSDTFENTDDRLNNIFGYFTDLNNSEKGYVDTMMIYSDEKYVYEIMLLDDKNTDEDNFNSFACVINTEAIPIYNNIVLLKTQIINNKPVSCMINKNDFVSLVINLFYHTGLIIDDKITKELKFSGDNPFNVIGNTFKKTEEKDILGLMFILYEENNDIYVNEKASILFDKEVLGRCFIILLCPMSYKKIWNLNETIINKIVDIKKDNKKYNEIDSKMFNETNNPFLLI